MSKLLKELTDEEMKVTMENGGRGEYCDTYQSMLPSLIISCAASMAFGGTSGCSTLGYVQGYINAYCK